MAGTYEIIGIFQLLGGYVPPKSITMITGFHSNHSASHRNYCLNPTKHHFKKETVLLSSGTRLLGAGRLGVGHFDRVLVEAGLMKKS